MHRTRELQSLAIHQEVAAMMAGSPAQVIDRARGTLLRWMSASEAAVSNAAYQEWLSILTETTPENIASLITSDTPRANRLRQSSPFAGALSARQVWAIKRKHRYAAP